MGSGIIEKFEEKKLPVLMVRPGKVLVGVHVSSSKGPEPMLELVGTLVGEVMRADTIYWYRRPGGSTLLILGEADSLEWVKRRAEEQAERLGLNVRVWAPRARGVVYDVFSYPIHILGEPVLLLRHADISHVIRSIVDRFKEPGKTLVYYLGFDCGEAFAEWIRGILKGLGLDKRETYTAGLAIARALGGILSKVESLGGDLIHIEVYDSLESKASSSNYDGCYLIKGFLEGYTRAILEADVEGEEVKCVKRGDENCEFKLHLKR